MYDILVLRKLKKKINVYTLLYNFGSRIFNGKLD